VSPSDWVTLLKLAGIQSIPLAFAIVAVALFGTKLADVFLKRTSDMYKLQLEKELTEFKARLDQSGYTDRVIFDKLYEKRVDAIFRLAELFDVFRASMARLTSPLGYQGDPSKEEQMEEARKAGNEFLNYYYTHQILFEESTCSLLDEVARVYNKAYRGMSLYTSGKASRGSDPTEKWIEADEVMSKEAAPLIRKMQSEFRRIIGVPAVGGTEDARVGS
jgi:hypothetical protein